MTIRLARTIRLGMALALLGALAACGPQSTPPPPPPPPPPPAPAIVIPPRPQPPQGAAAGLVVPVLGPDGVRQTVNARISPAQTLWNLRSAYNVAALSCQRPGDEPILAGYKTFLGANRKALTRANKAVDGEFRLRHGAAFVAPREAYMTQVYNYYALPPTLGGLCDAALAMARESASVKPAELDAFAARELAALDQVFENFFRAYDQYRLDLASWEARYGTQPGPGAVAAGGSH